jgi:hypothetical protein
LELDKNRGFSPVAKIAEKNLVDFIIGVGGFNVVVAYLFGYDRYDLSGFRATDSSRPGRADDSGFGKGGAAFGRLRIAAQ